MGLLKWKGDADLSVPLYVTRKTANGETAQYDMPLRQSIRVMLLAYLNLLVWGIIGLVAAVVVAVNAVIDLVQLVI